MRFCSSTHLQRPVLAHHPRSPQDASPSRCSSRKSARIKAFLAHIRQQQQAPHPDMHSPGAGDLALPTGAGPGRAKQPATGVRQAGPRTNPLSAGTQKVGGCAVARRDIAAGDSQPVVEWGKPRDNLAAVTYQCTLVLAMSMEAQMRANRHRLSSKQVLRSFPLCCYCSCR